MSNTKKFRPLSLYSRERETRRETRLSSNKTKEREREILVTSRSDSIRRTKEKCIRRKKRERKKERKSETRKRSGKTASREDADATDGAMKYSWLIYNSLKIQEKN